MEKILDIITAKMQQAFEDAGYDASFGRVTVSNRPDLARCVCRRGDTEREATRLGMHTVEVGGYPAHMYVRVNKPRRDGHSLGVKDEIGAVFNIGRDLYDAFPVGQYVGILEALSIPDSTVRDQYCCH